MNTHCSFYDSTTIWPKPYIYIYIYKRSDYNQHTVKKGIALGRQKKSLVTHAVKLLLTICVCCVLYRYIYVDVCIYIYMYIHIYFHFRFFPVSFKYYTTSTDGASSIYKNFSSDLNLGGLSAVGRLVIGSV